MKLSLILITALTLFAPASYALEHGCSFPATTFNTDQTELMTSLHKQLAACLKHKEPVLAVVTQDKIDCVSLTSNATRPFTTKLKLTPQTPFSVYTNLERDNDDFRMSKEATCAPGDVAKVQTQSAWENNVAYECRNFQNGRNTPKMDFIQYVHVGKSEVKKCDAAAGLIGQKNNSGPNQRVTGNTTKTQKTQTTAPGSQGATGTGLRASP